MEIIKRDGKRETFDPSKVSHAIKAAFNAVGKAYNPEVYDLALQEIKDYIYEYDEIDVETIQDIVESAIYALGEKSVSNAYSNYRQHRSDIRKKVEEKEKFIKAYSESYNNADATVDDNSNVASKNIAIMNNEIHKTDNIDLNRGMMLRKYAQLFPELPSKQYIKDLEDHIIYKHDESSFAGAVAPYCCSISMYPFLLNGIKDIGGLSAAPKNIDSYCGMYVNMIFAIASQFAGAVATPEFLLYFDYFARKEWGEEYYKYADKTTTTEICAKQKTIISQIHQYWQQIIYSINQPIGSRGMQAAFVNFSYFDRPFFESMFNDFVFPDNTRPVWESLEWLQWAFIDWFAKERERVVLTFPVESFAFLYKDGKFVDEQSARKLANRMSKGHCPFIYISDTVDSLSSCCRLKNMLTTKEFSFTNGNIGVMTGSKSVMTLNMHRLLYKYTQEYIVPLDKNQLILDFCDYLRKEIMPRVYRYQYTYNMLLQDMKDAHMLPVYDAGFISLNKQYLTIGINGFNEAAELLGIECNLNKDYKYFAKEIFSTLKSCNDEAKKEYKCMFNTEMVPAESLGVKNYNWDKSIGIPVNEERNLYASYMFVPSDKSLNPLQKLELHGRDYIGDYLDGGSACHINLDEHLSEEQYFMLMNYAGQVGCSYFTINVPYNMCHDCKKVTRKSHLEKCPYCGGDIDTYDRIIGYLTKTKNWSEGRRIEYKTRQFTEINK